MGQVAWKVPAFEERHRPRLPIPIPMRESAREAVAKEDIYVHVYGSRGADSEPRLSGEWLSPGGRVKCSRRGLTVTNRPKLYRKTWLQSP
jgi:hypothetical protein